MRDFLTKPISFSSRSDRFPVAAQADRCGEECRGDCQADPQTRVDEEFTHSEWCQRKHRHLAGYDFRAAAKEIAQQRGEVRSVKGNLLRHTDGQRR